MALKLYNNTIAEESSVKVYNAVNTLRMYDNEVWRKKEDVWETLFSGSEVFTASGSMDIAGINTNDEIKITAEVTFVEYVEDSSPDFDYRYIQKGTLPISVYSYNANVYFYVSSGKINFEFEKYEYNAKGLLAMVFPSRVEINEVRRKL